MPAAEQDPLYTSVENAEDYLHLIEFLDRIPPLTRVGLGEAILRKGTSVGQDGGFAALLALTPSGLLVFLADTADRSARAKRIKGLALARHTQLIDATGLSNIATMGVATEGSPSPGRSHDFVFIRGGLELDEAERALRDELYEPLPSQIAAEARDRLTG